MRGILDRVELWPPRRFHQWALPFQPVAWVPACSGRSPDASVLPPCGPPLPQPSRKPAGAFVEGVIQEIRVPELLFVPEDKKVLRLEGMPVFPREKMAEYPAASAEQSKGKAIINKARALPVGPLGQGCPARTGGGGQAVPRGRDRPQAKPQRLLCRAHQPEPVQAQLLVEGRALASRMGTLQEVLEEVLQASAEVRRRQPCRWQAQSDLIQARLELQMAQLYEYQSMLGLMGEGTAAFDPRQHTGWKLVPQESLAGDVEERPVARSPPPAASGDQTAPGDAL